MKRKIFSVLALVAVWTVACSSSQEANLSAQDFYKKIQQDTTAVIIDVRTEEEYEGGHLSNAKNIVFADGFDDNIKQLDKSKTILLYCLSGGRSAAALARMRAAGFTKVYNLKGGITQWRSVGLPESGDVEGTASMGISTQEYKAFLANSKPVLVDFFAEWCPPCKKMAPFMEKIKVTMADKLQLLSLDADKNRDIAQQLGISSLPTLILYKNQKVIWSHVGYISEVDLRHVLSSHIK